MIRTIVMNQCMTARKWRKTTDTVLLSVLLKQRARRYSQRSRRFRKIISSHYTLSKPTSVRKQYYIDDWTHFEKGVLMDVSTSYSEGFSIVLDGLVLNGVKKKKNSSGSFSDSAKNKWNNGYQFSTENLQKMTIKQQENSRQINKASKQFSIIWSVSVLVDSACY